MWLEREGIEDVVLKAWNTPYSLLDPLDAWQFKTRLVRKKT
jgi:hypothetical protein